MMRGYLGKPEETAKTVKDGWLHTGDVGVLDEDGYLTLVDRIKDMIIVGERTSTPRRSKFARYTSFRAPRQPSSALRTRSTRGASCLCCRLPRCTRHRRTNCSNMSRPCSPE